MHTNIKRLIKIFFVCLVFPLVYYYFTNEKANVRFTISQGIPANFITNTSEPSSYFVQEINVQNYGSKKAENIILKVENKIIEHFIIKNSEHDIVKLKEENTNIEIQYVELVPDGKFRLILKTITPISSSSIKVFDSTGLCKQIERLTIEFFINSIFFVLLATFILTMITIGLTYYMDAWKSNLTSKSLDELFHSRKPFWVNKLDWNKELKKAFNHKIEDDWPLLFDINKPISYRILDYNIENIKIEKSLLDNIFEIATKRLESLLLTPKTYYDKDKIKMLLSLRMPKNIDADTWEKIKQKLQEQYLFLLKEYFLMYSSIVKIEEYENEILNVANYQFSDALQDEYKNFIKENYIRVLLNINILSKDNIFESLQKTNYKNILNPEEQKKVEDIAYKIQINALEYKLTFNSNSIDKLEKNVYQWTSESDFDRLNKKIYNIKLEQLKSIISEEELNIYIQNGELNWLEITDKKKLIDDISTKKNYLKGKVLFDSLNKILSGQVLLNDKPSELDDFDWGSIMSLQNKLISIRNN